MRMKIILLTTLLLLASCVEKKPAVSTQATSNSKIEVDLLFENDGCKVYRFKDVDRYHYYTNCSETITSQVESCGKNCSKTVDYNNKTEY